MKRRQYGREAMGVSFDKIDGVIWYDGRLVPWADANVHILTHGLHYASAVFEGERAYGGRVFKSREHSERLKQSATGVWILPSLMKKMLAPVHSATRSCQSSIIASA